MIICLSSATRVLYRQDVLRTLGLPMGATIQFRYANEWVSPQVKQLVDSGRLRGESVLIAYADQSKGDGEVPVGHVFLIPIRRATIESYAASGKTLTLELKLEKFAHAEDLVAWNNEVSNMTGGALASWVDGSPKGLYCAVLNTEPSNSGKSTDIGDWEKVVSQLAPRRDFEPEQTFLLIAGLVKETELRKKGSTIQLTPWPDILGADTHRTLLVYHYHPSKSPENNSFQITLGPELRFEGPDEVFFESRYDLKRIRIRTGDPTVGSQYTWMRLAMLSPDGPPLRFDVLLKVRGSWIKRLATIVAVAAGLAGAQIAPLFVRDDVMPDERKEAIIAIVIFSLLASIAGVLGTRRSL